jgi:putative CRISPR-associated protein (TIGR02619 family)
MITISTCGTSILTNGVEQKISNILRMNTNLKENEISSDDKAVIDKIIELKKNILLSSNIQEARNISAEINGLFGICNEDLNVLKSNGSFHYLICTDTYEGIMCANLIQEYLESKGVTIVTKIEIPNLKVDNTSSAHNGLSELTKIISEITKKTNGKIIFNLVGGFKLLQGFMQTLGMFYADEMFYLFEGKKEPIKIPKLLVKFDYSDNIIESLRRISFELEALQGADLGVLILDGTPIMLSEWGELVWQQVKKSYYLKLRDPLLPTVSYSDGFKRDFDKLNNNDKVELHEHIDYVSKYLFTNDKRWNIASVYFHSLEGLPNGMTHEFDCFTGRDDRVYGKFKNNIFHIECIWRHL